MHSSPQEAPLVSFAGHALTRDQVAAMVAERRAVDPSLSRSPQGDLPPSYHFVMTTVNHYIDETLFQDQLAHLTMVVSDDWLRRKIMSMAIFHDHDGTFSPKQYDDFLAQRGLRRYFFENELRRILLLQELENVMSQSTIVSTAVTQRLLLSRLQTRLVSRAVFTTKQYLPRVQVTKEEEQAYYAAHQDEFSTLTAVKVHYLLLSPTDYGRSLGVTTQQIQQYYHTHLHDFSVPETRRARHILFFVAPRASANEESVVRVQALAVLEQLQKQPWQFAARARQYSADGLSKNSGGEIGWVHKGELESALDQSIFAAQKPHHSHGILALVKTRFGYHIVQVTGVRPAHVAPLNTVDHKIGAFLRQQKIDAQYPALAAAFADFVEDHPKSLAAVAQRFQLPMHQSPWIVAGLRSPDAIFAQHKVQESIFSAEFLAGLSNTPVVEIDNHVLFAAQIADIHPRRVLPFSVVQPRIHALLRDHKARALAQTEAQHVEPSSTRWSTPTTVSRSRTDYGTEKDRTAIFEVAAQQWPAYSVPVENPAGYVIYRISAVAIPTQPPNPKTFQVLLQTEITKYRQYDTLSLVQYWRAHATLAMDKKKIFSN